MLTRQMLCRMNRIVMIAWLAATGLVVAVDAFIPALFRESLSLFRLSAVDDDEASHGECWQGRLHIALSRGL